VNDPELYEWLALRRVTEGGMAKTAGVYFDQVAGARPPDRRI